MGNEHAKVVWVAEDVQQIRPDWDLDRCERELSRVSDRLVEKIVEFGSKTLDFFLPAD